MKFGLNQVFLNSRNNFTANNIKASSHKGWKLFCLKEVLRKFGFPSQLYITIKDTCKGICCFSFDLIR
jgi:hypothetical protein